MGSDEYLPAMGEGRWRPTQQVQNPGMRENSVFVALNLDVGVVKSQRIKLELELKDQAIEFWLISAVGTDGFALKKNYFVVLLEES